MSQEIKHDISEIKSDISEIKITLAVNTKSLETHIKRTDELQNLVEEFKRHIIFVNATMKVIISIGTLILAAQQMGFLDRWF